MSAIAAPAANKPANSAAPAANKPANSAAPSANKPANTKSKGLFGGLFGFAKKSAPNVGSRSAGNTNSNATIAATLQKEEMNKAKGASSFLPAFLGGKTKAQKNAEAAEASRVNGATGINSKNVAALNASLDSTSTNRSRTYKQRGGYRGKTMRLPGARNVLRVTGKTARKLSRVGVYGLKKVGNGVHVVTGLLGGLLKKGSNVVRKTLKMTRRNRKQ